MHSDLHGYTWCDANNVPKSRIDYVFISTDFIYNVDKIIIRRIPGTLTSGTRLTDHRLLKFSVKLSDAKRGPGYWKLNTSFLENNEYKEGVRYIIDNLENDGSAINTWGTLKTKIKDFSISFAKYYHKDINKKILGLEKQISDIENSSSLDINMNRKRELKNLLNELIDTKSKGAQIRSRANWVNEGEKNTKYFLSLEKKNQSNNVITKLNTENGIVSSEGDVLKEMCSFYEQLYTSKSINDVDIDDYFSDDVPNVNVNDKILCDSFPTIDECKEAVLNMKSNKSPGLDGIPAEFYKCFWSSLDRYFYDALKEIFINKEMSFSQRLSVITLIHKKDSKSLLKNYRPLSLTNTDYKIIAFVFARRLQSIIDKLIGHEQSAYIKGRFIGENARLILDNFISWMRILYTKPVFRLKNNGWISRNCSMFRGIRQGCPISALLYIFVAEILAIKLKKNENISGFTCSNMNKEIKNVQHADDLTMALKDIDSLRNTIETVNNFCMHAGSKINISKTEFILLGPLKGRYRNIEGINVTDKAVKCLGIYLGHDEIECYNKNWMTIYHDTEKLFESWKKRKLSLFGKCCVINTLALSKLIYIASILTFPGGEYIKKFNKLIYNFIWNKRDRIKRNSIIGSIDNGGIGIVDIETKMHALKASWVSRIVNSKQNLYDFVNSFCTKNNISLDYLLKTNENTIDDYTLIRNMPTFYQELFVSFNKCKKEIPCSQISSDNFLQQPLWNNRYICYKGKSLCYTKWIKSGILYVKDMFDENGNFRTLEYLSIILTCKANWLCEYHTLLNIFRKFV